MNTLNTKRAKCAKFALDAHLTRIGEEATVAGDYADIVDLITNLLHLADKQKVHADTESILRMSKANYDAEKSGNEGYDDREGK